VKGAVLAVLGGTGDDDVSVLAFKGDARRNREVEFALGAFDRNGVAVNFDSYLFG
jgi:hypothetical protein